VPFEFERRRPSHRLAVGEISDGVIALDGERDLLRACTGDHADQRQSRGHGGQEKGVSPAQGSIHRALLRFGCIAADKTIRPHVRCNETTRRKSKGKDEIYWFSVADGLEVASSVSGNCCIAARVAVRG